MIISKFPVAVDGDQYVAILIGKPEVEFGEKVDITDTFNRRKFDGLFVVGVDTLPANEIVQDVFSLWNSSSIEQFISALSQRYGTALPLDAEVTIYTLQADDPFVAATDDLEVEEDETYIGGSSLPDWNF